VVTNVNWNATGTLKTVVYVVTANDTLYAIDGAPPSGSTACNVLAYKTLLPTGHTAVPCANEPDHCATMRTALIINENLLERA
jgi:hypothetical protein